MSYTQSAAKAHCKVGVESLEQLINELQDWLVNHEDDIPEQFADLDDDDFKVEVSAYLELDGQELMISYDSEESDNYSSETFDFLSCHYANIMQSPFMKVEWTCYDSRDGLSSGTDYYDSSNKLINVENVIRQFLLMAA